MLNVKVSVLRSCGVVCLLAVAACAPMTKVKDVTADKTGYTAKHFSAQSINAEVVKNSTGNVLPTESFRELKVVVTMEAVQVDGKKTTADSVNTYYPLGNGLVRQEIEYSTNGIPVSLFYAVKYGVLSLRWQLINLQQEVTAPISEIKKVSRFESISARVGKESNLEFTSGLAQVPSTQMTSRWVCKATKASPANTISAKLKGQAIEVSCEITNGDVGAISGRTTFVFLESYGVPIVVESVTASGKSTYKITEIKIES